MPKIGIRSLYPVRRDLYREVIRQNRHGAVLQSCVCCVPAEQLLYLLGSCIGTDVVIIGFSMHDKIPHAAAYEIGAETRLPKREQNLENLLGYSNVHVSYYITKPVMFEIRSFL